VLSYTFLVEQLTGKPYALLIIPVLLMTLAGAGALLWWLPQRRLERIWANERSAETSLKTISTAEADFRANDRDANGVNDFWTGDVAGLYRYGLIERSVAEADACPLFPLVPKPVPKAGYFYIALDFDESVTPPEPFRQDTDGKAGKVHHMKGFAFLAYPADPSDGKHMFIVNENNTVLHTLADSARPRSWPSDPVLRTWFKY
jgi:hypothetical protein